MIIDPADGVKYACRKCIRGHRVSKCNHVNDELFVIKAKGRPSTHCDHCKQNRKRRNVHSRCVCGTNPAGITKKSSCQCDSTKVCVCISRAKSDTSKLENPLTTVNQPRPKVLEVRDVEMPWPVAHVVHKHETGPGNKKSPSISEGWSDENPTSLATLEIESSGLTEIPSFEQQPSNVLLANVDPAYIPDSEPPLQGHYSDSYQLNQVRSLLPQSRAFPRDRVYKYPPNLSKMSDLYGGPVS